MRNRSRNQVSKGTISTILAYVGKNPLKTATEISYAIDVCISSVHRALADLQAQNLVIKRSKFRYVWGNVDEKTIANKLPPPRSEKPSHTSMFRHPIVLWVLGDGRRAGHIVGHRNSPNWEKQ